jgi:glycosyltransferase involved in cell wall biosynthesis
MRIGLDLTCAAVHELSGTSLYSVALARALAREAPEHQLLACYRLSAWRRRDLHPDLSAERIPARYYWDRFDPPLARQLDVFHGLDSRAARFGRVRQVVTLHDVVSLWRDDFADARGRERRRRACKLIAERADAIVTPSSAEKEKIVEHLQVQPARVHVVPLAPAPGFEPVLGCPVVACPPRLR